ncbi:MAG: DUF938 domain-containing protein [Panacagrimonas sp.]
MNKPFSPSSERNRTPILDVLRGAFADRRSVLELGSGTGQHAMHFAAAMPHLNWQCSDREENLSGIRLWLDDAHLPNTPAPLLFDVNQAAWPDGPYDGLFTANTLHIMGWDEVQMFFRRLPEILAKDAKLAVYGPFNYGGRYTSESNAAFDVRLKSDDPRRGIRDFEAVNALAAEGGLELAADHAMPANNRLLVWQQR